jgi:hypothetical protein
VSPRPVQSIARCAALGSGGAVARRRRVAHSGTGPAAQRRLSGSRQRRNPAMSGHDGPRDDARAWERDPSLTQAVCHSLVARIAIRTPRKAGRGRADARVRHTNELRVNMSVVAHATRAPGATRNPERGRSARLL